ncbi:alpha-1,2-fucosyltransferase [Pedobacter sp. 22226]|uniref:alpha-1,2-fucosyltransferase n=1 Tax=Pedobacter sp. 22226 TaxID=3453894 RepID=UPI003F8389C7
MIVSRLNGGLGNQMFQYAFGRALSLKYNLPLYMDKSLFNGSERNYGLDIFPIEIKFAEEIRYGDAEKKRIFQLQESQSAYDGTAMESINSHEQTGTIFIVSGYWQSYKYFEQIATLIRKDFTIEMPLREDEWELKKRIQNSQSVMVHVRRGDYLFPGNLDKHGTVDLDYIYRGMEFYKNNLKKPVFYIFSDDIEWCRMNIRCEDEIIFTDGDIDDGRTSFYLMGQCKYFIISNSTFSWWAAWLGDFKQKYVVSPHFWYKNVPASTLDIIPPEWT